MRTTRPIATARLSVMVDRPRTSAATSAAVTRTLTRMMPTRNRMMRTGSGGECGEAVVRHVMTPFGSVMMRAETGVW